MAAFNDDFEKKLQLLGLTPKAREGENSPLASYDDSLRAATPEEMEQAKQDLIPSVPSARSELASYPDQVPAIEPAQDAAPSVPSKPVPPPTSEEPVSAPSPTEPSNMVNPLEAEGLNDAALKAAQEQARTNRLISGIGNAADTFVHTSVGNKPDSAFFDNLRKDADIPVQDIVQRRDQLMRNMTMANNMVDLAIKKLGLENDKRINDSDSPEANAIRKLVGKYEPTLANDPEFKKLSPKNIKDFFIHSIETFAKIDALKAAKEDKVDDFEKKENIKEAVKIRQEDRKLRGDLDKADSALRSQLDNLKKARLALDKYSDNSIGGTGPLATGFGAKKIFSSDLEKLQSRFNQISLGEMVKTFQNMSRAVDSDSERKAWEATQPNISLDDATNREIINRAIQATKSAIDKTNAAKARYDEAKTFDADVTSPRSPESLRKHPDVPNTKEKVQGGLNETLKDAPPPPPEMVKVVSPEGKTGSVPKDKLKQALERGFKEVQ